jgi:hypothetical protein
MINVCYTKDRYRQIETKKITELLGNDLLLDQVIEVCEAAEKLDLYCPEMTRSSEKVILYWKEASLRITLYYKRHTVIVNETTLIYNIALIKELIRDELRCL